MDVALEYLIADRVAANGHQQAEEYLGIAVAAILGEPTHAQVVLVGGLEVERGHVVEHDTDPAAENPQRLGIAYLLNPVLDAAALGRAQAVYETVYLVPAHADMEITPQIVHRLKLATGSEQAAHHQVAEHLILNRIVADTVIQRAVNQLGTIHPDLGVGQGGHEIGDDIVLFPGERKPGATLVINPLLSLALK
ncbi:MAG: hypothetical protein IKX22_05120 [Prevotella sp.]|nr:hypothetical protein [Prevotella sp.]